MADEDRERWDQRYAARAPAGVEDVGPPPSFVDLVAALPSEGAALELACGEGTAAVWLAQRGLRVLGVDGSPVAIDRARLLAERAEVADRCTFDLVDLDGGLPDGPPADLVLCHLFDTPALDDQLVARLAPDGVLAVAVLSEVGGVAGRFRVAPGALLARFGDRSGLQVLDHREADGVARILARRVDG
jgi:SAM-dependent methyltransferase